MGEHTEPAERASNEPPEHLSFAEAGERLNLSPDAVRMRAKRGKLATVRVGDRGNTRPKLVGNAASGDANGIAITQARCSA
jgi:hypothetical protein